MKQINEYLTNCLGNGTIPSLSGFRVFMLLKSIDMKTIDELSNREDVRGLLYDYAENIVMDKISESSRNSGELLRLLATLKDSLGVGVDNEKVTVKLSTNESDIKW